METVTLEQVAVAPTLAIDQYLAQLKPPPKVESASVVWAELVEGLHATNELSRLARALATDA
jgi:hypothetical protein